LFKPSNWFLVFTMVMFFAALFLFSGCGASDEPSSTADPETEAPAANTEDPAEEPADEPQPAGDCPAVTSVLVESTNGAYAERETDLPATPVCRFASPILKPVKI